MESTHQEKIEIEVPKLSHFIWVGGPIPKNYLVNIKDAAAFAKRENKKVCLWVDKKSNYHITSAKEDINIPNLELKDISELTEVMEKDNFFKTKMMYGTGKNKIETNYGKFLLLAIQTEMSGLKNLAGAADILRYIILYLLGGSYFDCDSLFLTMSENLQTKQPAFGIRVNGSFNFYGFTGGNDIIECTPTHEAIKETLLVIIRHYENLLSDTELMEKKRKHLEKYSEGFGRDRKNLTISMTGPGALSSGLVKFAKNNHLQSKDFKKLSFKVLANDTLVVGKSVVLSQSDSTWLNPKLSLVTVNFYLRAELTKLESYFNSDPVFEHISKKLIEIDKLFLEKIKIAKVDPTTDPFLGKFFESLSRQEFESVVVNRTRNKFESIIKGHEEELLNAMASVYIDILKNHLQSQSLDETKLQPYLKELSKNKKKRPIEWSVISTLANILHKFPVVGFQLSKPVAEMIKGMVKPEPSYKTQSFEEPPKILQHSSKKSK